MWRALGDCAVQRRGCVRITDDAYEELKRLVQENALRWAVEGRAPDRTAGAVVLAAVGRKGGAKLVKVWTQEADDHNRFMTLLHGAPGWRPEEPDPDDEEKTTKTRGWGGLPTGIRVFRPRQASLQRRIVVERALRAWCERTLGESGCTWHAVIHQPEGRDDPRNWHAHIVYTTAPVGREVNADGRKTGRFDFEASKTMPKMVEVGVVLDGNGPKKAQAKRSPRTRGALGEKRRSGQCRACARAVSAIARRHHGTRRGPRGDAPPRTAVNGGVKPHINGEQRVAEATTCRVERQGVASGHPQGRSAAKEPRSGLTRLNPLTQLAFMAGSRLPAVNDPLCENTAIQKVNPHILCSPLFGAFGPPSTPRPVRGALNLDRQDTRRRLDSEQKGTSTVQRNAWGVARRAAPAGKRA